MRLRARELMQTVREITDTGRFTESFFDDFIDGAVLVGAPPMAGEIGGENGMSERTSEFSELVAGHAEAV